MWLVGHGENSNSVLMRKTGNSGGNPASREQEPESKTILMLVATCYGLPSLENDTFF